MSPLHEIGSAVRIRRSEMGLSQEKLARLSGLSRTTVNQLEQGTIVDLSLRRASRLLDAIGIPLQVSDGSVPESRGRSMSSLEKAALTASVSFKRGITPRQLRSILLGKSVAAELIPPVRALLEDAPVSLLAGVVKQLQREDGASPAASWNHMKELGRFMGTSRDIWA